MSKCYYNIKIDFEDGLETQKFTLLTTPNGSRVITYACYNGVLSPYAENVNALKVAIYFHLAENFIKQHQQQKAAAPDAPTVLNTICDLDTEDAEDDASAAYWIAAGMAANDEKLMRKGLFRALVHYLEMQISIESADTDVDTTEVLEFDPANYVKKFSALCDKEVYQVSLTVNDLDGDEIEIWEDYDICIPAYLGEMMMVDQSDFLGRDNRFYANLYDYLMTYMGKLLIQQHGTLKPMLDEDDATPLERFMEMAHDNDDIDDEEYDDILEHITSESNTEVIYEIIEQYDLFQLECSGYRCGGDPAKVQFQYEDY